MNDPPQSATADWWMGGGQMAQRIRARNWAETPLGPREQWPQSLRTTMSLMQASSSPIAVVWGPGHVQLYNDGYAPLCGAKHPEALGTDFRTCWASAFDVIGEAYASAWAGTSAYCENVRLFVDRSGFLEETWFTFSFSPIADESGGIGGVFQPVTDMTAIALSGRRTKRLRELAAAAAAARTIEGACAAAIANLGEGADDVPFALLYRVDAAAGVARLVAQAGLGTVGPVEGEAAARIGIAAGAVAPPVIGLDGDAAWRVGEVIRTGVACELALGPALDGRRVGPYPEAPARARVQPVAQPGGGGVAAVLVMGMSARLPADEAYVEFAARAAETVGAAIVNATAYEEAQARAEALAAIDRERTAFFTSASHELRTPLTLVLGPIEDARAAGRSLGGADLARVHAGAVRLLGLVNDLLDVSRLEAGRMTASLAPIDLAAATAGVAEEFRGAIEGAGLTLAIDCALAGTADVDRALWEKIVTNLVANAYKYTLAGGVTVRLRGDGARARLEVSDTGVGIPAAELDRVFERFHRVAGGGGRSIEGSGLGLALVQELVKLHGGDVTVTSEVGRGSTFVVTVPVRHASAAVAAPPDVREPDRWSGRTPGLTPAAVAARSATVVTARGAAAARPSGAATAGGATTAPAGAAVEGFAEPPVDVMGGDTAEWPAVPSGRPRVLVADDNDELRAYLVDVLAPVADVEAVADAEAALASALADPPELVLTDRMMPGTDGLALLRALRGDARTADVPVVVVSARGDDEGVIDGLEHGAGDYLVKPFSSRELRTRVRLQIEAARLRRAQRALTRELDAIIEHLPHMIFVKDAERLAFTRINRAGEALLGVGRAQLLGKTDHDFFPAEQAEFFIGKDRETLAGRTPVEIEAEPIATPAGRRWLHTKKVPIFDDRGRPRFLLGISEDITVARLDQEALVRAKDAAETASRELDAFSHSVAHDLRAPLRGIDGFAQALSEDYGAVLDDEGRRYLRFVRESAQRMGLLIDDLLDLSRVTRSELVRQPIDVSAIARAALARITRAQPARVVEIAIADGLTAEADPRLVAVVFDNLLGNAWKFTRKVEAPRIEVAADEGGRGFVVRDNGAGFDPAYAHKLFGVFQRLHTVGEFEGTGVGLATVQRIVHRHGGRIWAHGAVGRGASFHFTLDDGTAT